MDILTYESVQKLYKESYKWKFDLLYFILKNNISIYTPFHITPCPKGTCLFQTVDIVIYYNKGSFEMNILSWTIHNLQDFILLENVC
jgi:hypothetical protein